MCKKCISFKILGTPKISIQDRSHHKSWSITSAGSDQETYRYANIDLCSHKHTADSSGMFAR